jgi:hypothetical protein
MWYSYTPETAHRRHRDQQISSAAPVLTDRCMREVNSETRRQRHGVPERDDPAVMLGAAIDSWGLVKSSGLGCGSPAVGVSSAVSPVIR